MTTKEKRKEIYDFIQEKTGTMADNDISYLSTLLKELCKIYSETLLKDFNLLTNAHKTLKKSIGKPIKVEMYKKPIKKKEDEPFFNKDFLNR